jgi:hemerythrin
VWQEDYSVGKEELDQQHKRMFELANQTSEKLDSKSIKKIITTLYNHVQEHFGCEERHMLEIGYPKLDEHRELHNELICNLDDIAGQSFDTPQSISSFKQFISDWVINHIMDHDKDYFGFSRKEADG